MKRKSEICAIGFLILTFLTGCAGGLPEMSAEQENAVVEYAAGVLMRHMKDFDSRLVDLSLYKEPVKEQEPEKEPEQGGMDQPADTDTIDVTEEVSDMTLQQLLMPEGMEISYTGFAFLDTYPPEGEANPYFRLDASEGKKLLVMSFVAYNTTEEEIKCDVISLNPHFSVTINDTKPQNALHTMLLDDLSTYIGKVEASGTVSLVLLAEIDADVAAAATEMKLNATTEAGSALLVLQ